MIPRLPSLPSAFTPISLAGRDNLYVYSAVLALRIVLSPQAPSLEQHPGVKEKAECEEGGKREQEGTKQDCRRR